MGQFLIQARQLNMVNNSKELIAVEYRLGRWWVISKQHDTRIHDDFNLCLDPVNEIQCERTETMPLY